MIEQYELLCASILTYCWSLENNSCGDQSNIAHNWLMGSSLKLKFPANIGVGEGKHSEKRNGRFVCLMAWLARKPALCARDEPALCMPERKVVYYQVPSHAQSSFIVG
jgi:hypothetical protein